MTGNLSYSVSRSSALVKKPVPNKHNLFHKIYWRDCVCRRGNPIIPSSVSRVGGLRRPLRQGIVSLKVSLQSLDLSCRMPDVTMYNLKCLCLLVDSSEPCNLLDVYFSQSGNLFDREPGFKEILQQFGTTFLHAFFSAFFQTFFQTLCPALLMLSGQHSV